MNVLNERKFSVVLNWIIIYELNAYEPNKFTWFVKHDTTTTKKVEEEEEVTKDDNKDDDDNGKEVLMTKKKWLDIQLLSYTQPTESAISTCEQVT